MSPRYAGRHSAGAEPAEVPQAQAPPARPRVWRKVAVWVGLAVCVAFTVVVVVSLVGLLHDVDHPDNDGWLCSADSSTCRP
ncbi:hypothetical protein [Actinacidiphila bryophytorum]|uniref:hypothetical protein n=1 Tax=Actinacidiphila bryophytorum TaxID=1436133 RepID=UPI002176E34B|nr:hypothetical protein [Actinacidiphila bryophytorum]UWE08526.1 hypothetical protein NYE86_07170 [Actinacidiphila bryophytorum]